MPVALPPPLPRPLAASVAVLLLLGAPGAALASQAEAKDVARAANCVPGKVGTVRQLVGGSGETVYKVNCVGGAKNLSVLVQCRLRQCVLLR